MFISGLHEKNKKTVSSEDIKKSYEKNMSSRIESLSYDTPNLRLSEAVVKNKDSDFIVKTLNSIYTNGLVSDLSSENFLMLRNSKLTLRNINSESSSETWFKSLLKKTLSITIKYDSLSEISNKINDKIQEIDIHQKTGEYYSSSDQNISLKDIHNTKKIHKVANEIIMSISFNAEKDKSFNTLKEHGLSEQEILTYVFAHELSHTIQNLHENDESLIAAPNSKETTKGVVSYAADRKFLGVPLYFKNKVYTNMLESYADVRGLLMVGSLHPEKFNKILDAVIEWRTSNNIELGHNTVTALNLLKEKYPNGLPVDLDAKAMHTTARNLASISALTKQEYFMKLNNDVDMDTGEMTIRPTETVHILNNIRYISLQDKTYDRYQHLKEIEKLKESLSLKEKVSNVSLPLQNFCSMTGEKLLRDRSGFIIDKEEILLERIGYRLSKNPSSEVVEKLRNAELKIDSNRFKLTSELPSLDKMDKVLTNIKENSNHTQLNTDELVGIFSSDTLYSIRDYLSYGNKANNESNKNLALSKIASDLSVTTKELGITTLPKFEMIADNKPKINLMNNIKELRNNYLDNSVSKTSKLIKQ